MLITTATAKRRRERHDDSAPHGLQNLPADWRELLVRWVRRGGTSRWETLANDAGTQRQTLARQLLDWLLGHGWIVLDEKFERASWWPYQVRFLHLADLRGELGVHDPERVQQDWLVVRENLSPDSPLSAALDALPARTALARVDLDTALARWRAEERSGTQRDFAYFTRGQTKAVSRAEWDWLAASVDLAAYGIERHTPLFCVAASAVLHFADGDWPLACAGDFAALTPTTLGRIHSASTPPREWRLLENRTSFEREARARESDVAVVWLPGYPPGWWLTAMQALLDHLPAPARIACDPDPHGVDIALIAARCWQAAGLAWSPWNMDRATLAALPSKQTLSDDDRACLVRLREHAHAGFADLLDAFDELGVKGEQEGWR